MQCSTQGFLLVDPHSNHDCVDLRLDQYKVCLDVCRVSSVEPMLITLHRTAAHAHGGPRQPRNIRNSHGDILAAVDGAPTVYDVAVVHPGCPTHRKAAAEHVNSALAVMEREKINTYRQLEGALYDLVPLIVETHRRLGRAFVRTVNAFNARAADALVSPRKPS